jgi:HTH-type transcriptional regulator/antitoxin HigA
MTNQYHPESVTHPGETLREKLQELNMGAKEFALKAGKPEKTITQVLKGNSSITPDMAIQFERILKIPARFWLRYQMAFDEYKARVKEEEKLLEAESWAKLMPYAAMVKLGWVEKTSKIKEKVHYLYNFFGIASHEAWSNYYCKEMLKAQFRISLKHTSQPHGISAWLRQGEIQSQGLSASSFDAKKFKENLYHIKKLMVSDKDDFFTELQELCLDAGVKVLYTPCLPKAAVSGATRWLGDSPLIQLSGRYMRNDIFWFTFFHEAGHILLHGKKYIYLELKNDSIGENDKEREANDFATKWTFSEKQEAEFLALGNFKHLTIETYAAKVETLPCIIIGRMIHRKKLNHSFGKKKYFKPVSFN